VDLASAPACVVAADLDGTLLDRDHRLTPRTLRAVARLRAAGGLFVAVTARPLRDAAAIARRAGADLLVCAGGGVLHDPVEGRTVSAAGFRPAAAARMTAVLRAAVPGIRIGLDDGARCVLDPGFDLGLPGVAATVGAGPVAVAGPVLKVILQYPGLDPDALADRARAALGAGVDAPSVSVPCAAFAEVLPAGVHKGTHLSRLFPDRTTGVPTLAFGDMPSDLPMLAWAGTSVAVANAHPAVLARCDRVTASNDEDGVAVVLEQITAGLTKTG
jgi:hydroxymethylpyrimidine pyrophosphatase-like HAD family hydrolase